MKLQIIKFRLNFLKDKCFYLRRKDAMVYSVYHRNYIQRLDPKHKIKHNFCFTFFTRLGLDAFHI